MLTAHQFDIRAESELKKYIDDHGTRLSQQFYVERIVFIVFVGHKVDWVIIIIQPVHDLHVNFA